MYEIKAEKTKNVYKDLCKDKEFFDFSNYPKDSKYYNGVNNLVVGKIKDETCDALIKGFVGLKSNM